MKLLKTSIFMSLVLLVGACSQAPEPLIKEQVQSSSKEDYEYLKETSKAVPLEIDLYKAIAIAIKNNRDLRIQIMDSALNQGQTDVVKFDMLPKLSSALSSYLNRKAIVHILSEQVDGETPSKLSARLKQEARQKMLDGFQQNSNVQKIINHFSGEISISSITTIDE